MKCPLCGHAWRITHLVHGHRNHAGPRIILCAGCGEVFILRDEVPSLMNAGELIRLIVTNPEGFKAIAAEQQRILQRRLFKNAENN